MTPSPVGLPDAERVSLAEYRAALGTWLDEHHDELAPRYDPPGTLDEHVAQMQRVKAILFDAGWMRFGWPERVGGLGGSPMLRTELGAAHRGSRPDRSGPLLPRRGARAHPHRLRVARDRRRGRPPTAVGRRDVVPGVLRARQRE